MDRQHKEDNLNPHKPITSFSDDDKPREKAMRLGVRELSNSELLAILIATGTPKKTAIELCQEIMEKTDNSLRKLYDMEVSELMRFDGIGVAKAVTIKAALEIGHRVLYEPKEDKIIFRTSKEIFNYIRLYIEYLKTEEIWIIYLKRDNSVISKEKVSNGSQTHAIFDIKEIMRHILEKGAISVVLVHNHPSGNLNPSIQDKDITKKLKNACETFDVRLLDHLIIGENEYFSFTDNGLMESL